MGFCKELSSLQAFKKASNLVGTQHSSVCLSRGTCLRPAVWRTQARLAPADHFKRTQKLVETSRPKTLQETRKDEGPLPPRPQIRTRSPQEEAQLALAQSTRPGFYSPQATHIESTSNAPSLQELLEGSGDFWKQLEMVTTVAYGSARSLFFLSTLGALVATLVARGVLSEKAVQTFQMPSQHPTKIMEGANTIIRWDAENFRRGLYKAPYDMDLRHRQWNFQHILEMVTEEFRMVHDQQERRLRGGSDEVTGRANRALLSQLPEYYQVNWHYMEDGWLSDRHARLFDFFSEVGLSGLNDASKRQALLPIRSFVQEGRPSRPVRLLDVACGTGRFLTFVRDNFPAFHVTGLDLSPNQIARATADMRYFENFHADTRRLPPLTGSADFVWGQAEKLPVDDESLDVITCLQLFHELPPEVRVRVAGEMYRALKPGGLLVCSDAFQAADTLGPSEEIKIVRESFTEGLYEPYYDSYVAMDMVGLFASAGFALQGQSRVHAQKCWALRKPE